MTAIITQLFSYMIEMGVQYGYICTGEAFIFLKIADDPSSVYYYLSIPNRDVDAVERPAPDSGGPDPCFYPARPRRRAAEPVVA